MKGAAGGSTNSGGEGGRKIREKRESVCLRITEDVWGGLNQI